MEVRQPGPGVGRAGERESGLVGPLQVREAQKTGRRRYVGGTKLRGSRLGAPGGRESRRAGPAAAAWPAPDGSLGPRDRGSLWQLCQGRPGPRQESRALLSAGPHSWRPCPSPSGNTSLFPPAEWVPCPGHLTGCVGGARSWPRGGTRVPRVTRPKGAPDPPPAPPGSTSLSFPW